MFNIPKNYLPLNATVNPLVRPSDLNGAIEGGETTIYWFSSDNGASKSTTYSIKRYPTLDAAIVTYANKLDSDFKSYDLSLTLEKKIHADEHYTGCGVGKITGRYRCVVLLRYEEFIVTISSSTDISFGSQNLKEIVYLYDEIFNQVVLSD
ncbi:MAG: hypothetical protein AAF902_07250 [Chloroflexota bacterium]